MLKKEVADQISQQLRHTLTTNGLTVRKAADLLNVTERSVRSYLKGLTIPNARDTCSDDVIMESKTGVQRKHVDRSQ